MIAQTVQPDSFLTLHYRLADTQGNEFVSTFDLSPSTLQMGSGQLAEPLERCLIGLAAHERRVFQLAPDAAFGERNPRLIERIARAALPPDMPLLENSLVEFSPSEGRSGFAGYLCELTDTTATFDFNHPMAGKPVRFEVEIIGIM